MNNLFSLLYSIAFVCFFLLAGPWCFIWSVNTLMVAGGMVSFHIPFTFWTWLAAVLIGGLTVIPKARRR